jgi:hypothetical protein
MSATFSPTDGCGGTDRLVVSTSLGQRIKLSTTVHITMELC